MGHGWIKVVFEMVQMLAKYHPGDGSAKSQRPAKSVGALGIVR
jgi:hypothetical protein